MTLKIINIGDRQYRLKNYKEEGGNKYKDLINIYDGKLNNIGDKTTALSKSWYMKADKKEIMKELKNNTVNYFRNICKGKSSDNMYTTFKDFESQIKGKGYTKGFVSLNIRATNDYKHKENLAYLINIYNNPMINKFFKGKGVTIEENDYALSMLIQWMFRSRIRDNQKINIYIPSIRMRKLLESWLNQ